jgi:HSP20 family protein
MSDLVPVRRGERVPVPRERQAAEPRWDPFREFEELWERTAGRLLVPWGARGGDWAREWTPPVDIEETNDAWLIEMELPGMRPEDIDVEVGDHELTISGEIVERERAGVLRHRTRRTGRFAYRTTLPAGVDPDRVEAKFDNGMLAVRVPRPERSKPRKIKIT